VDWEGGLSGKFRVYLVVGGRGIFKRIFLLSKGKTWRKDRLKGRSVL